MILNITTDPYIYNLIVKYYDDNAVIIDKHNINYAKKYLLEFDNIIINCHNLHYYLLSKKMRGHNLDQKNIIVFFEGDESSRLSTLIRCATIGFTISKKDNKIVPFCFKTRNYEYRSNLTKVLNRLMKIGEINNSLNKE